eukprot:9558756-Alexandrium_andersonii.AAC.1
MGGAGSGSEGSTGEAGTSAHQSPSRRPAGPSTHTWSSPGKSGLVALLGGVYSATRADTRCGNTRSHTH